MLYTESHKHWQLYARSLYKFALVRLLFPRGSLVHHYLVLSWVSCVTLKRLFKAVLFLVLLLPYSFHTQALLASTAQAIHGSEPYLTFDGGVTKVTTADDLLSITLSDGTTITSGNNNSANIPIMLPKAGETLADVQMSVPTTTDTIDLNTLIGAPNNYWGDDDGDGQGTNGITITGSLSVVITDRYNQAVSRSDALDVCNGPYKVVLTSTGGSLITQYGVPNSSTLTDSSATYYINPKAAPVICNAKPNLQYGTNHETGDFAGFNFAGPSNVWNPNRGFLVQSTNLSSYGRNFPTTAANNLYFDLVIGGTGPLRWPTVTKGGITVTVTPILGEVNNGTSVRVTFTGPAATAAQISSNTPSPLSKPNLPQTFELVGYDSDNTAVVKYGFELKQWFVDRGDKEEILSVQASWCSSLGYRLPKIKELSNAVCDKRLLDEYHPTYPCDRGIEVATPPSDNNNYQRNIGAGLLSEWGDMMKTPSLYSLNTYLASDTIDGFWFSIVSQEIGFVQMGNNYDIPTSVICTFSP